MIHLLVAVLILFLTSCGGSSTEPTSTITNNNEEEKQTAHIRISSRVHAQLQQYQSENHNNSQAFVQKTKLLPTGNDKNLHRSLTAWPEFSAPRLVSNKTGPWDFSGSNALWFYIKYTAVNGQTQSFSVVLDSTVTSRNMPQETLVSEVFTRIAQTVGNTLNISQGPLAITGPNETGGKIELIATIEQNVTLTDLGFSIDNRVGEGGSSVSGKFYSGTLAIYDTINHGTQYKPWTLFIAEENMQVIHNTTLDLPPGIYELALVVSKGNEQYLGIKNLIVNEEEEIDLVLDLVPAVGNQQLTVETVSMYSQLNVSFTLSQIDSFNNPMLGIKINESEQYLFTISNTQANNAFYLDTLANIYSFEFRLYDGNSLLGKSQTVLAEEAFGSNSATSIQIYPLLTQINIDLNTDISSTGYMNLNIPSSIINTMGNANNIDVKAEIFGITDSMQSLVASTLESEGENYVTSVPFEYQYFQTANINLQFIDKATGINLGGCSGSWQLISFDHSFTCNAVVIDENLLYTQFKSVLVINTLSIYGNPISGIVIKDQNSETVGITGSSNGADGYLKTNLYPGEYTIQGYLGNESVVTSTFTLEPLEALNLTLIVNDVSDVDYPATSCKSMLIADQTLPSGYYTIDPDGPLSNDSGNINPMVVYCNMTLEDGGWTLIGYHANNTSWNSVSLVSPSYTLGSSLGFLDIPFWQSIIDNTEDGLMVVDEHNNISKLSSSVLSSATCTNPLEDFNNGLYFGQSAFYLFLTDDIDCDGSSNSLSGIFVAEDSTNGIVVEQGDSAPFNPWPYSQNTSLGEHDHLWFYVR